MRSAGGSVAAGRKLHYVVMIATGTKRNSIHNAKKITLCASVGGIMVNKQPRTAALSLAVGGKKKLKILNAVSL